jgi:hypothetical protein
MKKCRWCTAEIKTGVTCKSEECKSKNNIYNRDKGATSSMDRDVIMKNRFLTNSWY